MELRLTASSKRMIARAVVVSGLAPGDLAYETARRIVEGSERFVLRDEDRDAFFRACSGRQRRRNSWWKHWPGTGRRRAK
jgi:uncharacterized protein (DUF1778 family)